VEPGKVSCSVGYTADRKVLKCRYFQILQSSHALCDGSEGSHAVRTPGGHHSLHGEAAKAR